MAEPRRKNKIIIESTKAPRRGGVAGWVVLGAAVLAVAAALVWLRPRFADYVAKRDRLEPSGGVYFWKPVTLPVERYRQADPAWAMDQLGPTPQTLAQEGCAVASAAMVLKYYGCDTDPGRLNRFVQETEGGYTERGWIYWERAALVGEGAVEHVYEDAGSHYLIDRNLLEGNPVIAKLRYPSGITHFVVIVGKQGYDYLVQDPAGPAGRDAYPLKEFGSPIEGIRFFERVPPSG